MMANIPKVSIILPVYNGERFLARAIRSVQAQSFQDWELVVVDDGSKDGSAAVARTAAEKDKRLKYVFQENSGIQKALNHGLSLARGEYVARVDDDDEWLDQEKLQAQVDFLNAHPEHVLIGTGAIVKDEAGRELYRYLPPIEDVAIRQRLLQRNCFIHSSVLFRAEPVRRLGGYPETKETLHVEDYDLWLRLGRNGKLANLPRYATGFTLRPGNISSRNKSEQFQKDLRLTSAYRRDYPGYLPAMARGYLRLWGYRLFRLLPGALRNKILKTYKEF